MSKKHLRGVFAGSQALMKLFPHIEREPPNKCCCSERPSAERRYSGTRASYTLNSHVL